MNLMMLLQMASDAMPDRLAVGHRDTGFTYQRLYQLTSRGAGWLRETGATRLMYLDEPSMAQPIGVFAAAWAGVPFVPVSYRLADERLRALVADQVPAVVLCGQEQVSRVHDIDGVTPVVSEDFLAMLERQADGEAPDWDSSGEGAAVLLHTSGTSGSPKVAVLRHRHLVSYIIGSVEFMGAAPEEATLMAVPPYHVAGTAALLSATYSGRRLVQLPRFDPQTWIDVARREGITHAMVVPTMLARILDILESEGGDLPNLRHLAYGGGRMPRPVIEQALRLLPRVGFVNAYGLTETASTITVLGPDDHWSAVGSDDPAVRARLGSVGRALPSVEVQVRDEGGIPVPPGTTGEVWVRGEQVAGEYGTATVLDEDGWFSTKDAGYLDDEGYLFLEGRADDVIVRGGENLSPGEIEDVLVEHPYIADAAVCGIPDLEWGEVVAAAVVPAPGAQLDEHQIKSWVAARLRSSRTPAVIEVWPELPYTDTGKLLRRLVKPQLAAHHRPGGGTGPVTLEDVR